MGDDPDLDELDLQKTGVAVRPQSITAPSTKDPLLKLVPLSKNRLKHRPKDDISVHPSSQAESTLTEDSAVRPATNTFKQAKVPRITLNDLPPEIQDAIIGHLSGSLHSAASGGQFETHGVRNWNMVMRHPRRKQLSDLALVTEVWRGLVQQRLYRHIKVKGTKVDLDRCGDWFLTHDHLQQYVRHVEVWVPVWEVRGVRPETSTEAESIVRDVQVQQRPTQFTWVHDSIGRANESSISQSYQLSSQNATLEEILHCAKALFPMACVLTIEGGHCKKPRRIQHFREYKKPPQHASKCPVPSGETPIIDDEILLLRRQQTGTARQLPEHKNITTLVLKGAWNIIRTDLDFHLLSFALPNLREWQCSYAKPKPEAYRAMCHIFRYFPPTIVHLNISLEGLHAGPTSFEKWRRLYSTHHICHDIARICPQLETLAYTGRVCHCLFHSALRHGSESRDPCRLKSVDLNVRNCCRDASDLFNDGTGINNWNFITCFERLVEHGISALKIYQQLSFLRIRFVDLDSPAPLLNPYFQLHNRKCTGIWSEAILALLCDVRPTAGFDDDLSQDLAMDVRRGGSDGRELKTRPKSIKVASYREYASMVGWA